MSRRRAYAPGRPRGSEGIDPVRYEETDAYRLTEALIVGPDRFLRHLSADE